MSALKGLTFAAYVRPDKLSAEVQRRNKLITHLREQLAMAEAQANGEVYTVTKRKWVETQDGGKTAVEVRKRLKAWWRTQPNGTIMLALRYGARPIEFEKGKAAIVVKNQDELLALFSKLIAAVDDGELDPHLAAANKQRTLPKRNAA